MLVESKDLIVASVEEPNFAFLDPSTPSATNMIAMLSKQTFKTLDAHKLDRNEIANCCLHIDKKISGNFGSNLSHKSHAQKN